jgi:hypothetical protein
VVVFFHSYLDRLWWSELDLQIESRMSDYGRANPYKRNGGWFIEIGPFNSSKDALQALLLRILVRRGERIVRLSPERRKRTTRRKK